MTFRTVEKKNFPPFIDNLIRAMEVVGVREKAEGKYEFAPLETASRPAPGLRRDDPFPEKIPSPPAGNAAEIQNRQAGAL